MSKKLFYFYSKHILQKHEILKYDAIDGKCVKDYSDTLKK